MNSTKAYDFQLLEDLPEEVYDCLWVQLHPSSYYPEIRADADGRTLSRMSWFRIPVRGDRMGRRESREEGIE